MLTYTHLYECTHAYSISMSTSEILNRYDILRLTKSSRMSRNRQDRLLLLNKFATVVFLREELTCSVRRRDRFSVVVSSFLCPSRLSNHKRGLLSTQTLYGVLLSKQKKNFIWSTTTLCGRKLFVATLNQTLKEKQAND